jgi:iron-sulfur cluster assembly accessory protein
VLIIKILSKIGISVTQNAWTKMKNIIKVSKNKCGFIYSVSSGGCNGFNFELNLLDNKRHREISNNKIKPILLKNNNTHLYIDPSSEMYLLGTTIDYINEDYIKGKFENKFIFNIDKKLASSCGCGTSFTPKNM